MWSGIKDFQPFFWSFIISCCKKLHVRCVLTRTGLSWNMLMIWSTVYSFLMRKYLSVWIISLDKDEKSLLCLSFECYFMTFVTSFVTLSLFSPSSFSIFFLSPVLWATCSTANSTRWTGWKVWQWPNRVNDTVHNSKTRFNTDFPTSDMAYSWFPQTFMSDLMGGCLGIVIFRSIHKCFVESLVLVHPALSWLLCFGWPPG